MSQEKLITIHQPNYLPWPGFFHKWMISDAFVILDTVQYHKNEWQNRNRIKTAQGAQWLTVPVGYRFPQTIQQVTIAASPWARKQVAAIEQAYAKAPFLNDFWMPIKDILMQPWDNLSALNVALIRQLGTQLGCHAPLLLASELRAMSDDPTGRLIDICQHLEGSGYLSGSEGRNYLQRDVFEAANLDLFFQEVAAPNYPQLHGDFVSHLSVLDLLLNSGEQAVSIIQNMGGKVR